jgi:hypothetical protein
MRQPPDGLVSTAIAPVGADWLSCSGWCCLDIESTGERYPDCLREEFAGRPIERPGSIYQLARNRHGHPGVPFVTELYPGRNHSLVGFLNCRLVEGRGDNPVLWI